MTFVWTNIHRPLIEPGRLTPSILPTILLNETVTLAVLFISKRCHNASLSLSAGQFLKSIVCLPSYSIPAFFPLLSIFSCHHSWTHLLSHPCFSFQVSHLSAVCLLQRHPRDDLLEVLHSPDSGFNTSDHPDGLPLTWHAPLSSL